MESRWVLEVRKLRSQVEGSDAAEIPVEPLADHLAVSLAYDSPHSIRSVSQEDLSNWNTLFTEALAHAKENLQGISREPFQRLANGVYKSPWCDCYDASRLLLLDLIWGSLDVEGDYIAAVPDRNTLLITGTQNLAGLEFIAGPCESACQAGQAVSAVPLVLENQSWLTFSPDRDHPLLERFRALQLQERAADYSGQTALLEAWHQKTGEDTHIATYSVVRNTATGALSSYCIWAQGVVASLPEVDEVFFVTADGSLAGRSEWQRVSAELSDLMKPVSLYPKRFLVERFPDADRLAALLK